MVACWLAWLPRCSRNVRVRRLCSPPCPLAPKASCPVWGFSPSPARWSGWLSCVASLGGFSTEIQCPPLDAGRVVLGFLLAGTAFSPSVLVPSQTPCFVLFWLLRRCFLQCWSTQASGPGAQYRTDCHHLCYAPDTLRRCIFHSVTGFAVGWDVVVLCSVVVACFLLLRCPPVVSSVGLFGCGVPLLPRASDRRLAGCMSSGLPLTGVGFFFFCCCCPGSLSSPVSFGGSGPGFLYSLLPPFLPTASCGVLSFCHRRLVAINSLLVAGRSHGLGCIAASNSGVPDLLSVGQSGAPLCSKDCVHGECSLRAFLSPMPLTHGVVKAYGLRTLRTWVA